MDLHALKTEDIDAWLKFNLYLKYEIWLQCSKTKENRFHVLMYYKYFNYALERFFKQKF